MVALDMLRSPPSGPLPPSPPRSAHRRTPTVNDFPIPAGQPFMVTKRDQGLISPTQSSFTFAEEENLPHALSTRPSVDEMAMTRDFERGSPGETASKPGQSQQEREIARKKSQYYTEVFAVRESSLNPRERVHKGSIIMAEVKTNVIVQDEFLFLSDLSQHLSQRYQRPKSSIFVTLDHSACLLYAGSFDSAYILTVSALPSQIMHTTNKRNAALIQSFFATSLGVLPDRGVIRFVGIPEEYFATAGTTVTGHIERLQKAPSVPSRQDSETEDVIQRKPSRRDVQNRPPKLSLVPKCSSMPGSRMPSPTFRGPAMPAIPDQQSPLDKKAEKVQKAGKRKSIFAAFFGR